MDEKPVSLHAGHRRRLRERFAREGLSSFAEHEVLELLLTYAVPRKDTSALAHQLIARYGSLAAVLEADAEGLAAQPGMGETSASLLALMPQLFARYRTSQLGEKPVIVSPADAQRFLEPFFMASPEEKIYLVSLDGSGRLLRCALLRRGTVDEVSLYPREVVEEALRSHAHAVVLAHNHPSGNASPSAADVEVTRRVIEALSVVSVRVLDHLIFCRQGVFSMSMGGLLGEQAAPVQQTVRTSSVASFVPEMPLNLGWKEDDIS